MNTSTTIATNDFLSLTAAARRAQQEGLNIRYTGLRCMVAAGLIRYVPYGKRIYVYYPNVRETLLSGITAEQSKSYQEMCRRHFLVG